MKKVIMLIATVVLSWTCLSNVVYAKDYATKIKKIGAEFCFYKKGEKYWPKCSDTMAKAQGIKKRFNADEARNEAEETRLLKIENAIIEAANKKDRENAERAKKAKAKEKKRLEQMKKKRKEAADAEAARLKKLKAAQ